jgi:hypothetical protein
MLLVSPQVVFVDSLKKKGKEEEKRPTHLVGRWVGLFSIPKV